MPSDVNTQIRAIVLVFGCLWLWGCAIDASMYRFARHSLVPSSPYDGFTVGAFIHTGADLFPTSDSDPSPPLELKSRKLVSVAGWWHMENFREGKGVVALGVQFMHNIASPQNQGKALWSNSSALWIDAVLPVSSPNKSIFFEAGTYMGVFTEMGPFVEEITQVGSSVTWGLMWGMCGGVRFKDIKGNEFLLRYNLGAPGSFSIAYRVKSLTFVWSTNILGTITSPYPVVTAGATFSF